MPATEFNFARDENETKHFSKTIISLLDKDTKKKMEFGTLMHSYFEYLDFKNIDLSIIDSEYRVYFERFFESDLMKNIKNSLNIYKEYEFIYYENDNKFHGIIDLMIEYSDHIDIIDYKLSNIRDTEYIKQLTGYKDYISKKTNKPIYIHLYSIFDSKFLTL